MAPTMRILKYRTNPSSLDSHCNAPAPKPGPLDAQGFRNVEFEGSYPVGNVWLSDPDCPIGVQLEAFSPFIPLDVEDSGLPATVLNYRFSNLSGIDQNFSVGAWLENAVYPFEPKPQGRRIIELSSTPTSATLHCHATAASAAKIDGAGSMSLRLLNRTADLHSNLETGSKAERLRQLFANPNSATPQTSTAALDKRLAGGIQYKAFFDAWGEFGAPICHHLAFRQLLRRQGLLLHNGDNSKPGQ